MLFLYDYNSEPYLEKFNKKEKSKIIDTKWFHCMGQLWVRFWEVQSSFDSPEVHYISHNGAFYFYLIEAVIVNGWSELTALPWP